jgi:hypothetical protein
MSHISEHAYVDKGVEGTQMQMSATELKNGWLCIDPVHSDLSRHLLIDNLPQAICPLLLENVIVPASDGSHVGKNGRVGPENLLWLEGVGR